MVFTLTQKVLDVHVQLFCEQNLKFSNFKPYAQFGQKRPRSVHFKKGYDLYYTVTFEVSCTRSVFLVDCSSTYVSMTRYWDVSEGIGYLPSYELTPVEVSLSFPSR